MTTISRVVAAAFVVAVVTGGSAGAADVVIAGGDLDPSITKLLVEWPADHSKTTSTRFLCAYIITRNPNIRIMNIMNNATDAEHEDTELGGRSTTKGLTEGITRRKTARDRPWCRCLAVLGGQSRGK